jgi:hypothetical protein
MFGLILFIFGIQEFIHHKSVSSECKNSSSKNRGSSEGPKTHNGGLKKRLQ